MDKRDWRDWLALQLFVLVCGFLSVLLGLGGLPTILLGFSNFGWLSTFSVFGAASSGLLAFSNVGSLSSFLNFGGLFVGRCGGEEAAG